MKSARQPSTGCSVQRKLPRAACAAPGRVTLLRKRIAISGESWDQRHGGFLEADSVAHCGTSLTGNFIWSLTYTCLGTSWTEGRAVWNNNAAGVLEQTKDVEAQLPFSLRAVVFDNGSEWLNWTLVRHWQERLDRCA